MPRICSCVELGGFILAVVITLIGVVTFVSVAVIRSRRRVWARFARRHGLQYRADGPRLEVTGRVQGRPFRLYTPRLSSDDGTLGVQDVRMELGLQGGLPADTSISRIDGWVGAIDRASEAEAIASGDEVFDRCVLIESAHKEQVLGYLTPDRREAIRRLLVDAQTDDAGVQGASVFIHDREMLTDLERLEERLGLMLRMAPRLDGVGP